MKFCLYDKEMELDHSTRTLHEIEVKTKNEVNFFKKWFWKFEKSLIMFCRETLRVRLIVILKSIFSLSKIKISEY